MRYQVHQLKLDNGAEGLVVDIPNAVSVYSMLNFAGGRAALADLKHKNQVPQLLTRLANEVVGYKDNEFYNALTRNGASLDAYGGNTCVEYSVKCPRFDAERTLDLIAKSLERPDINASNLAREKKSLRSKLKSLTTNGDELIINHTLAHFGYPRLSPQESLATLDGITPEDIQEYRTQNFTTDNLRFIIAGDFNGNLTMVDRLRQLDLPRGKRFKYNLPVVEDGTKYRFEVRPHVKIITTGLGFALRRPLTIRDALICDIIRYLLFVNCSSHVFNTAHNKGWSSYVTAIRLDHYSNITLPLGIIFKSSAGNLTNMIQLISQALNKLGRGELPEVEAELERIKCKMIGKKLMAYETPKDIANALYIRYFATGEVVDLNAAPEVIKSITLGDIQQLARELTSSPLRMVGLYGDITEADAAAAAATLDAALK